MLRLTFVILTFTTSCYAVAAETKQSADNFVLTLTHQYKILSKELKNNQFNRPLALQSSESSDALKGEIYAVLDYPFEKVNSALNNPEHWCDVLILHINVKYCQSKSGSKLASSSGTILNINLGKKHDQPLAETYQANFNYKSITTASNYFSVEMKADSGPLGTKNYRIWVEATPLNNKQTFLHFTYHYSFGLTGRLAMKGYLNTIGKDKIGFSIQDKNKGQPAYIQGVRGVVERNTMRYYLAIDAYLAALKFNPYEQSEKRLELWFDSTEQFAEQLHEVERDAYLKMKRKEVERQNL